MAMTFSVFLVGAVRLQIADKERGMTKPSLFLTYEIWLSFVMAQRCRFCSEQLRHYYQA
jgi:hypothetical protein